MAVLFSLWFLILPLILGIILLNKQNQQFNQKFKAIQENHKNNNQNQNQLRQEQENLYKYTYIMEDSTNEKLKQLHAVDLIQRIKMISLMKVENEWLTKLDEKKLDVKKQSTLVREKENKLSIRKNKIRGLEKEYEWLMKDINILEKKKMTLEDEILLQSFGFYDNKFSMENSDEYLVFLEMVRDKQRQLIRLHLATEFNVVAIEEGNLNSNNNQRNHHIKLALRAFNSECETFIGNVKFNNIEVIEKRIRTSFYNINKLNKYNSFYITDEFLKLKLEELFLVYEFTQKKHEEKKEQRRVNELIREEKRAQKELEEELNKIKKEEQHLLNVLSQMQAQISETESNQYKERLSEIQKQKEEIDYRVKNTKAGYVYIISNLGCLGEDVYKIGMTRRLDPMDRVRELGGASVPFHFDVHAVIFSEDAPALEASLHRAFHHRRVNRINERKEFFNVKLSEIKKIVHQNHNAFIEFAITAEAKENRETLQLEKEIAKQHII